MLYYMLMAMTRHSAETAVPRWWRPNVLPAQRSQCPNGECRNSGAQMAAPKCNAPIKYTLHCFITTLQKQNIMHVWWHAK